MEPTPPVASAAAAAARPGVPLAENVTLGDLMTKGFCCAAADPRGARLRVGIWRCYQWAPWRAAALTSDLLAAASHPNRHTTYLGCVTLCASASEAVGRACADVVDGHHRLTLVSLIAAAALCLASQPGFRRGASEPAYARGPGEEAKVASVRETALGILGLSEAAAAGEERDRPGRLTPESGEDRAWWEDLMRLVAAPTGGGSPSDDAGASASTLLSRAVGSGGASATLGRTFAAVWERLQREAAGRSVNNVYCIGFAADLLRHMAEGAFFTVQRCEPEAAHRMFRAANHGGVPLDHATLSVAMTMERARAARASLAVLRECLAPIERLRRQTPNSAAAAYEALVKSIRDTEQKVATESALEESSRTLACAEVRRRAVGAGAAPPAPEQQQQKQGVAENSTGRRVAPRPAAPRPAAPRRRSRRAPAPPRRKRKNNVWTEEANAAVSPGRHERSVKPGAAARDGARGAARRSLCGRAPRTSCRRARGRTWTGAM